MVLAFVPAQALRAQGPAVRPGRDGGAFPTVPEARAALRPSPAPWTQRDGDGAFPFYRRPFFPPLASLIAPGTGQLLRDRSRGVVYLAAEAWLLLRTVALSAEGRRERAQFQSLALAAARREFSPTGREGPFAYYETMSHYVESGVFDRDPGPEFDPESDPETYNGSLWRLARQTFFGDPEFEPPRESAAYRAALAFYQSRAVRDEFRWSWRNAQLEQDVFRASIRASDEAFRAATNRLGVLLLNHLVSTIDAFISTRLDARGALPSISLLAVPTPGRRELGVTIVLGWPGRAGRVFR